MNVFENERVIKLRDNKARLDRKGVDYSYNNVEYEAHLGWLIRKGFVIIDFDNLSYGEIVEKIIEDLNIKTIRINTDRGKHFIFKLKCNEFTDWTHKYNFIGLECDAKGNGQSQQKSNYECIKRNGALREQKCYGNITSLDEVDYIPEWLLVNQKGFNLRLAEGDGRNTTLYAYQINLINSGFNKEQCRYITKEIINKYVLIDKMSDVEIDTICRDEAYEKIEKKQTKKLDLDNLLNDFRNNENITTHNQQLVWYIDGHYTMSEDLMHNRIIDLTFGHDTLESTRKEIMLRLKRTVPNTDINSDYIILKNNNLYNLFTGDIIDNVADIKAVYKYNYMYDENISEEDAGNVNEFLNFLATDRDDVYHPEVKVQLLEMIGCCIAPNTQFQKAFFLKGDGANGKSVLLRLIDELVGMYATSVNFKEFTNIFSLEYLVRGTCNIIDDLGNQKLEDTDTFKQIVGGGKLTVQAKNQNPYIARSISTLVIAANDYPKLGENSEAIERRLVFIELNNKVRNRNLNLVNELIANEKGMTWLFTQSLKAYREAFNRGRLIETDNYQQTMAAYKILDSRVLQFSFDNFVQKDKLEYSIDGELINEDLSVIDIDGKTFNELYTLFKIWCIESNVYPMSAIKFSKEIRHYLEDYYTIVHTRIDGKQNRYFRRKTKMLNEMRQDLIKNGDISD